MEFALRTCLYHLVVVPKTWDEANKCVNLNNPTGTKIIENAKVWLEFVKNKFFGSGMNDYMHRALDGFYEKRNGQNLQPGFFQNRDWDIGFEVGDKCPTFLSDAKKVFKDPNGLIA